MTPRTAIAAGALLMAAAVAFGAFGAHALKARLAPDLLAVWQTGVTYHALHALALLVVGMLKLQFGGVSALNWTAWLFLAGIVLFSGSLYLLALGAPRTVGFVTPFGGLSFIAAWVTLAFGVLMRS